MTDADLLRARGWREVGVGLWQRNTPPLDVVTARDAIDAERAPLCAALAAKGACERDGIETLWREAASFAKGFDYMMRTLAAALIEAGETPEIHADKLAQQAAALIEGANATHDEEEAAHQETLDLLTAARAEIERLMRDRDATRGPASIDRETLGRAVRDEWIAWAREQPTPKASWLVPWEELPEPDKEVDRRIGERIAGLARPPCPKCEAWARAVAEMGKDEIPCGHTVRDLIGGTETAPDGTTRPEVTKCGACLAVRQEETAARRCARSTPAFLAIALAAAENALLAASGWRPTDRPDLYLDTKGDERLGPGTTWPRCMALDFARERAARQP